MLKVNRGFANNYLAPQGLGEPASAEVIAAFEVKLAERAAAEAAAYDAAAAQAQQLIAKGDVSISRAAGEDGEVEAVSAQGCSRLRGSTRAPRSRSRRWTTTTVTVTLHKQAGRAAAEARGARGRSSNKLEQCLRWVAPASCQSKSNRGLLVEGQRPRRAPRSAAATGGLDRLVIKNSASCWASSFSTSPRTNEPLSSPGRRAASS